jgi:hypothetical protein
MREASASVLLHGAHVSLRPESATLSDLIGALRSAVKYSWGIPLFFNQVELTGGGLLRAHRGTLRWNLAHLFVRLQVLYLRLRRGDAIVAPEHRATLLDMVLRALSDASDDQLLLLEAAGLKWAHVTEDAGKGDGNHTSSSLPSTQPNFEGQAVGVQADPTDTQLAMLAQLMERARKQHASGDTFGADDDYRAVWGMLSMEERLAVVTDVGTRTLVRLKFKFRSLITRVLEQGHAAAGLGSTLTSALANMKKVQRYEIVDSLAVDPACNPAADVHRDGSDSDTVSDLSSGEEGRDVDAGPCLSSGR